MKKKQVNYKIGIYIRVSTQEQADNPEGSIKNQRDRLEQMVKLKNFEDNFGEVVDVFVDEAKSGKDTNRPELQRMLREIRKGNITLVMASELSRISRNIQDFAKIWNMMKDKGCSFFSLRENFDTTTAAGEMVLYTLANLSQFERRQVSERVSANFTARAKRGLSNGGVTPVGYKRIEGKPGYLEIDNEYKEVVEKCFEYFLQEETLALTSKRLNKENYQLKARMSGGRPTSKKFNIENLYRILTNKAMIGIKTYEEFGEVHEAKAVWKGIISRAKFDKVRKILKNNRSVKKSASSRRYPYILTGLVYCADCGDRLCGKSAHGASGKVGYYEHGWRYRRNYCKTDKMHNCSSPTRFSAEKVHELVLEKITKLIQSEQTAKRLLGKAKGIDKKDPIKAEIRRYQNKKVNIDRKLEMLAERLTELPKEISATPLYAKMTNLQKQKEEMNKLLEDKRKQLKGVMDTPVDTENWKEFLQVFGEIFKRHLTTEQQTKLIKKLIFKIELGAKDLKIHYFVGEDYIKRELADLASSSFFWSKSSDVATCSSSLTYGGASKDRTCVHNGDSVGLEGPALVKSNMLKMWDESQQYLQ
jgi:site-specific DNA recombinase